MGRKRVKVRNRVKEREGEELKSGSMGSRVCCGRGRERNR